MLKENLRELPHVVIGLRGGYKEYLGKSRYVSQQEPEAEIVEMMDLELVFKGERQ